MMHSTDSSTERNTGPRRTMRIPRKLSLTLSLDDGSCIDLSNLCICQETEELYPQRESAQCLPDIEDRLCEQLWEAPVPLFRRPSQKKEERTTPPRSLSPAPTVPISFINSAPVRVPPPPPAPTTTTTTTTPTAFRPRPNGEPGPRPKVNYKKLYGSGSASTGSKRDLRQSQRHMSFQEQQLQRALEEEERVRQEPEKNNSSVPEVEEEDLDQEEAFSPPVESITVPQEAALPPVLPEPVYPPSPAPRSNITTNSSQTVMEIAPNMFVPYKGSHETWEAVQRGQFTVTTCFACCLQLVVIDSAEFLVCPDCHTVSPLSYNEGGSTAVERCGVGLGIKREWCDTEAAVQQPPTPVDTPYNPQPLPTRPSYEQRHQEKQAKFTADDSGRSVSPEQDRYGQTTTATYMLS